MNKEQEYLIELTKHYLSDKCAVLKKDIDYKRLFLLAKEHNLSGIIYCVVNSAENKSIIEKELFNTLQNTFFDLIYTSNMQMQTLDEIKALLNQAGIRYALFKGAVLRNIYPVPESRAMGDIDVLIDEEKRSAVKTLLTENGFICKNSNGPVWDYEKNGVLFEIHTSILNGKVGSSTAPEYFKNAIEKAAFSGCEGELSPEYHFEYLLCHIAHHFWFYGAGIKLILDLAVMLKNFEIDLDKVVADLDGCGLGDFSKTVLSVCFKWYSVGRDFGKSTEKTEEFLACHGAFGGTDRSAASVIERKNLEDGKTPNVFCSRLRLLFPSYRKMREIPYIKFIDGRPYLTPYAWVYRLFYNIKNRKKFMMTAVKELGDSKADNSASQEFDYFKEIGLL